MIRINVPSDKPLRTYEYKGVTYAEQEAAIFTGGHFPKPFHLSTKVGESYPKGDYTLDPACFDIGDNGKLVLRRVRLLPMSGSSLSK